MVWLHLAEVKPCVAQSHVGGVVFGREVEVASPLYVVALGLSEQICIRQHVNVLANRPWIGLLSKDSSQMVRKLRGVRKAAGSAHQHIVHIGKETVIGQFTALDHILEVDGLEEAVKVRPPRLVRALGEKLRHPAVKQELCPGIVLVAASCRIVFGKRKRVYLYRLPSAAKLRGNVRDEEP